MTVVLQKEAESLADANGMVEVVSLAPKGPVFDNGKHYAKGVHFHMHKDLVPAHVQAGQVSLSKEAKKPKGKQHGTPADKQVTGSPNK